MTSWVHRVGWWFKRPVNLYRPLVIRPVSSWCNGRWLGKFERESKQCWFKHLSKLLSGCMTRAHRVSDGSKANMVLNGRQIMGKQKKGVCLGLAGHMVSTHCDHGCLGHAPLTICSHSARNWFWIPMAGFIGFIDGLGHVVSQWTRPVYRPLRETASDIGHTLVLVDAIAHVCVCRVHQHARARLCWSVHPNRGLYQCSAFQCGHGVDRVAILATEVRAVGHLLFSQSVAALCHVQLRWGMKRHRLGCSTDGAQQIYSA